MEDVGNRYILTRYIWRISDEIKKEIGEKIGEKTGEKCSDTMKIMSSKGSSRSTKMTNRRGVTK